MLVSPAFYLALLGHNSTQMGANIFQGLDGRLSGKLFHVEQFGANGNGLGEVCCKRLCFVRDAVA